MKPVAMNKTAIIRFIIDEIILKLWNVSSNMRKRVQMILEGREITVKEYKEIALALSKWVRVVNERRYLIPMKTTEIKKGISNYLLKSHEEANKIISLNGELRCHTINFEPKKPLLFDRVKILSISSACPSWLSNCYFNRIDELNLCFIDSDEIEQVLSKIKSIDYLKICAAKLSNLNLSSCKVNSLYTCRVNYTGKVVLPANLNYFFSNNCENIQNLIPNKITRLKIIGLISEKDGTEFVKNLKDVKIFPHTHGINFAENFKLFPSTIRKTDRWWFENNDKLTELNKHFPYLIKLRECNSIETAQMLNLRDITISDPRNSFGMPRLDLPEQESTFRPRKINIKPDSWYKISKHPELFEKISHININSTKFNLDLLPAKIKKIKIIDRINIESSLLSRFEKEYVEIGRSSDKDKVR